GEALDKSVAVKQPTLVRRRPWLIAIVIASAVLAVALGGWIIIHARTRAVHDLGRIAIIVMPFANLDDQPEQNYFVDAITSNLTTDLSRVSGISVIAYSTALTYRGRPMDARQIGKELGVGYVLEGSVQRFAENIEVNARLVNAGTGTLVWAD